MPTVSINDIDMYYHIEGTGEPLVLISGFSSDHTSWQSVVPSLSRYYQVIILDNRGAGQSSIPEGPYSISQMADDVIALCDHLAISKACFAGSSMGGMIVQTLLHRHPSRVQKAVICNSATEFKTPFKWFIEAQYELLSAGAPVEPIIKNSLSWVFSYGFLSQPSIFETMLTMRLNNPHPFTLTGYAGQMAALNTANCYEGLKNINAPCLVLSSDEDIILPASGSQVIANHIPNAQSYCFLSCGHAPHIEQPDVFSDVLLQFLSD